MKKSSLFLAVILAVSGVGAVWYADERRESQHQEEYLHHVTNAFSAIQAVDQSLQFTLENWEKSTPQEVSISLLSISSSLALVTNEMSDLEGYLRYHDDANSGGSTVFLSHLFKFYQDAVDTRLRKTWQYTSVPTLISNKENQWLELYQDLTTLQQDFHHLARLEKSRIEQGKWSEIRDYWLSETHSLQFKEVVKRYEEWAR